MYGNKITGGTKGTGVNKRYGCVFEDFVRDFDNPLQKNGAEEKNRTSYAGLFRAALYQ